jgi:hypothetical protein
MRVAVAVRDSVSVSVFYKIMVHRFVSTTCAAESRQNRGRMISGRQVMTLTENHQNPLYFDGFLWKTIKN